MAILECHRSKLEEIIRRLNRQKGKACSSPSGLVIPSQRDGHAKLLPCSGLLAYSPVGLAVGEGTSSPCVKKLKWF